jgi:hypothetical protein
MYDFLNCFRGDLLHCLNQLNYIQLGLIFIVNLRHLDDFMKKIHVLLFPQQTLEI